ncbi:MAG: class A beta-lactamase [Acidobacteriota bacterium]
MVVLFLLPLLAAAATLPDLSSLAAPAQGQVGAAFSIVETEKAYAFHGSDKFPMQSVYKLPIAFYIMRRVDRERMALNQLVQITPKDFVRPEQHSPLRDRYPQGTSLMLEEVLEYSVSQSDGTACDVLLRIIDGPEMVDASLNLLKIEDMRVLNTEKQIGAKDSTQYKNYSTPIAAIQFLHTVMNPRALSPASREKLFEWMTNTPTGLNRIKGELPPGTLVAHKTGTSGTRDGMTAATNDIGIVTLPDGRHLAVAIFIRDSKADLKTREGVIARIARAAYDWALATQ